MILCLPGTLTSVYARARLRRAHPCRSGRGVRVEGLQAKLLCHPHPIRLAAQARQIIFAPSDSASAFAPLYGLFSYQCWFSISRARQALPAWLPPHQALVGISLPSSPHWGWMPGSRSKVRVTLIASERRLNPLFFSPSLSCFLPDHSHQHTSMLSHL